MATFYLKPGFTNLAAGASYEGGVAPAHATADEIVVRAGKWDIPGVTLASVIGTITSLTKLTFEPGFLGTWGTGSAMVMTVTGSIQWDSLGGTMRQSSAGTNALLQCNGGGSVSIEGGTWTEIRNAGTTQLSLAAGLTLATVKSTGAGAYTFVYPSSGSDRIAELVVSAGQVVCERNVDLANIAGSIQTGQGVLTMQNSAIFTDGAAAGRFDLNGGRLNMKSAGTVAVTGNFNSGDYDMSGATGSQTITSGFVAGIARVRRTSGSYGLTITTEVNSGARDSLGLPPLA